MAHSVTISLPETIFIRATSDGAKVELETGKLPSEVVARIFEAGAKVLLTNAFNGGGKEQPEADRFKALKGKMDSWYKGEFSSSGRGDSWMTELKNQFVSEQMLERGVTPAQVEKELKELVRSTFGEKESATFSRFLDAVALHLSKEEDAGEYEDIRAGIEQDLAERTAKAKAEREAAASKVEVKGLMLGAFRKG